MKALQVITAFLISTALLTSLSAQEETDKIATVDMQKLLNDFYKTANTRTEFEGYQDRIQEEDKTRQTTIDALVKEVRKLQQQGEDPSLSRDKKEELFKKAGSKSQEVQALAKERQEWLKRKQAALAEKAKLEFTNLRSEIMAIIQKTGEERGYDFIFDRSGSSGAQVPILAFAKDATDLTGLILELINKDASSSEENSEGEKKSAE